jgi:hypothetical protein
MSLMMETMGSRRRLVLVVAASVVTASEDLAGSAVAASDVVAAASLVVAASAVVTASEVALALLVVTAAVSEVVAAASLVVAASEVVTALLVVAAASGVVEDSVVGAASEVVGTRVVVVVVSSAATVVLTDSAVEVLSWTVELRIEEEEVVGVDEDEDTTPVGPMMMTGELEVVVSSGSEAAELVVAAAVDSEGVVVGSSSVSVGWRMLVGRPPVDELRSVTVVSSEEDSCVVSSAVSASVVLLVLESTGAKNEVVTGEVGSGEDTREVVETMMVVTSPLELWSSDEVGSEDSRSVDSRSLTVALKLVTKFLDSDRVSKGVLSAGGNASGLVVAFEFVNWRLTCRGK